MGTNHMGAPVLERQPRRLSANKDERNKKTKKKSCWLQMENYFLTHNSTKNSEAWYAV